MTAAVAKHASVDSQFVELDGVRVHYREEGDGPAVLLIHGTLGDTTDWDGWVRELSDKYRVVRLDLPGFGLSGEIANGNYSIDRTLSVIDALMDHVKAPQFAIAGISYGGIVAFRYAATRSERTSALVLVNSAGIQTGKRVPRQSTKEESSKPARNLFTDPIVLTEDVERFYEAYINDPGARDAAFIQRKLDFLNIEGRDEVARKATALYERGDPVRVLSHVRDPALVLWGLGNKALDTSTANAFIDALTNAPAAELVTFPSGGHYINVEKPVATARAAREFLDRYNGTQPECSCAANVTPVD